MKMSINLLLTLFKVTSYYKIIMLTIDNVDSKDNENMLLLLSFL